MNKAPISRSVVFESNSEPNDIKDTINNTDKSQGYRLNITIDDEALNSLQTTATMLGYSKPLELAVLSTRPT